MKRFFLMLLLPGLLFGAGFDKLPSWAQTALADVDLNQLNDESGMINLLDVTNIEVVGAKLRIRRNLLRYVTRDRGVEDASIFLLNGDDESGKLLNLKGWNLLPKGKVIKLDKDNVVTVGLSSLSEVNRDTLTGAYLEDVVRGSVVVFESTQESSKYFGLEHFTVLNEHPTQTMIFSSSSLSGGIRLMYADGWQLQSKLSPNELRIENIPGYEFESRAATFSDAYPEVMVIHSISKQKGVWDSWDELAKWYAGVFATSSGQKGTEKAAAGKEELEKIHNWVDQRLSYRQVYLSLARGWEPIKAAEVERLAYGDCKDMTCAMSNKAAAGGLLALPALVDIGEERQRLNEKAVPLSGFNHVITAFQLEKSLGLAAEVEAKGKRYLLVDGTAKGVPFGFLPSLFKDLDLMICSAEGASWVHVPDSALEKAESWVKIRGGLDANGDLRGRLEIKESGDALNLRSTLRMSSSKQLEPLIREAYSIPGVVDLRLVESSIQANAEVLVSFELTWPSFLRHDSDGFALPGGLLTVGLAPLERGGLKRRMPIQMSGHSRTHWSIELTSETGLRSAGENGELKNDFYVCKWKLNNGKVFTLEVEQEFFPRYFSCLELEKGVNEWDNVRNDYLKFSSALVLYTL